MYIYIVLILLILLFFFFSRNCSIPEHFGSYQVDDRPLKPDKLVLKYSWSEKNKLGETAYDKFYQSVTNDRIYGTDPEYAYREIGTFADDGVYDTKFSTLSDNELSNFTIPKEKIETSITFNGNKVSLSQYEDNRQIPRSVFTNQVPS